MAKRFKFAGPKRGHFLRQWREHARLSQEQIGVAMGALGVVGLTKASISRTENGKTPYTQDVLEAFAEVVGCVPAELLARPPLDPEEIWALWDRLAAEDKPRAAAVLRAFIDKTSG
jgi:transcriptional regulator with XRE-family HTH domain